MYVLREIKHIRDKEYLHQFTAMETAYEMCGNDIKTASEIVRLGIAINEIGLTDFRDIILVNES